MSRRAENTRTAVGLILNATALLNGPDSLADFERACDHLVAHADAGGVLPTAVVSAAVLAVALEERGGDAALLLARLADAVERLTDGEP